MLKVMMFLMSVGFAFAQQAPEPQVTPKPQLTPEQTADRLKEAMAKLQALEASDAKLRAEQGAREAKLKERTKALENTEVQREALARQLSLMQTSMQTAKATKVFVQDRWWNNPETAQYVGLTPDQQKKMDDVLQQYRIRLIDLNASLEKEEVTLEPLVGATPLDDAKVATQIDRVAEARAELEKANGRMLLGIRKLLTPEQWNKLNRGFSLVPPQK